jgi:hypothetical protein
MTVVIDVRESPQRSRAAEIRELEELWRASPDTEAPVRSRIGEGLFRRLGWLLAAGWIAFFVSVSFQPAPNPEAVTPLWADLVIAGLFLALGTAALTGLVRSPRIGFAAATVAGLLGMAIAVGCKTTEHHGGSWWLYELGATTALMALSAAGLTRRS